VHQDARLGLRMGVSAGGNVGERLMAVGWRNYRRIRGEAVDWLGRVEIEADRIDDRPESFSGGMRQRLQIAKSMVTRPRLVFMDEPTGGLETRGSQLPGGAWVPALSRSCPRGHDRCRDGVGGWDSRSAHRRK
jgi:ABC-type phosphonate transport system ATPase subunit